MIRTIPRLLSIGADPRDDEDLRLRKVLVLAAALMIAVAAIAWGAIYWAFGEPLSALIPWSYVLATVISVAVFAFTRTYAWFAVVQFGGILILPFLLMWSLGGIAAGSMVALWAWLAPLAARLIGHRTSAFVMFAIFAAGIAVSAVLQPRLDHENALSDAVIIGLFVLNVVVVGAISLILVDASSGGREDSIQSMRGIVRRYFSHDVADAILEDPDRQELGGDVADVTILFADLGGYTTFSDQRSPHDVLELLNSTFAAALPEIRHEGGTPVQLPGDAVMAIFGAPKHTSDHAERAARAALAIQDRSEVMAAADPERPRFRIGINSGDALVGNIGDDQFRNFTAIGDTVNTAQRFQTLAQPGQVVTGPFTSERLGDAFGREWLDEVTLKGKSEPIRPCVLSRAPN